ncbi:tetratricopeptide repeat protein, partial [Planktothrix agardhii]
MDEQRFNDYINLIQELINCENGKEWETLRNHAHLVDEDLVQIMQLLAEEMEQAGEANAGWLRQMAQQIGKLLTQWEKLKEQTINLYQQGAFTEGIVVAEQVLELARFLWGKNHPNVAASCNNLAGLYKSQGRYSE